MLVSSTRRWWEVIRRNESSYESLRLQSQSRQETMKTCTVAVAEREIHFVPWKVSLWRQGEEGGIDRKQEKKEDEKEGRTGKNNTESKGKKRTEKKCRLQLSRHLESKSFSKLQAQLLVYPGAARGLPCTRSQPLSQMAADWFYGKLPRTLLLWFSNCTRSHNQGELSEQKLLPSACPKGSRKQHNFVFDSQQELS